MKILVTGAKGFIGKNLIESLKNIRDGKDRTRSILDIEEIFKYDINSTIEELNGYCSKADFVFHLAGINRPTDHADFMRGNHDLLFLLLETLKSHGNKCPIMLSSSIQAALCGPYLNSEYGRSKLAAEQLLQAYGNEMDTPIYIYRFPNVFGKWCKPNYNSVIATFCHNLSHDMPITVNDPDRELELLYIDDLVAEMLNLLEGNTQRCEYDGLTLIPKSDGRYCFVPTTHHVTLTDIVNLLKQFRAQPETLMMPAIPEGSFAKKLFSTYLSYLPEEKILFPLKMNIDNRGSFTELIRTKTNGQFSVNISKPGITKGEHWHQSKWEMFIVVSGHGLIQERKIGTDEVLSFEVSGEEIKAVYMLPGHTHNIINLSGTEELVTLMWASEQFDSEKPDTYRETVNKWSMNGNRKL